MRLFCRPRLVVWGVLRNVYKNGNMKNRKFENSKNRKMKKWPLKGTPQGVRPLEGCDSSRGATPKGVRPLKGCDPPRGTGWGGSWASHTWVSTDGHGKVIKSHTNQVFTWIASLKQKSYDLTFVKSGVRHMTVRFKGGKRPHMTPYDPHMTRIWPRRLRTTKP